MYSEIPGSKKVLTEGAICSCILFYAFISKKNLLVQDASMSSRVVMFQALSSSTNSTHQIVIEFRYWLFFSLDSNSDFTSEISPLQNDIFLR